MKRFFSCMVFMVSMAASAAYSQDQGGMIRNEEKISPAEIRQKVELLNRAFHEKLKTVVHRIQQSLKMTAKKSDRKTSGSESDSLTSQSRNQNNTHHSMQPLDTGRKFKLPFWKALQPNRDWKELLKIFSESSRSNAQANSQNGTSNAEGEAKGNDTSMK